MDAESTTQEAQASTAENTAAESQTAEQTGTVDAGTQTESQTTSSTAEQKPSTTTEVKPESKPVSRRSAQYRIEQLVKENQELRNRQQQPAAAENTGSDPAPEQNPDISALVQKEVEKRLNPFVSEHSKTADDAELSELFSGDRASERSKYESKIREMWNLPQYKDTAAADLYKIVSFDDAVKAATERAIETYKKAQEEAKGNSGSGSSNNSNRTGSGGKSVLDMSPEELQAHNDRIKAGLKP